MRCGSGNTCGLLLAVPKVSLTNGLIYLYTRNPGNDPALQAWYFTAVDFETGELVYKVLTGIRLGYNNHYGSISRPRTAPWLLAYAVGYRQEMAVAQQNPSWPPFLCRIKSSATGRNNILAIPVDLFDLLRHCINIGLAGVDIAKRNNGLVDTNVL
jgi:hypothetical protein